MYPVITGMVTGKAALKALVFSFINNLDPANEPGSENCPSK